MDQLTPPQAFYEAQRLMRMGDYPRAAGLTKQLWQNIPDEPLIKGLHGMATARMGLYDQGLKLLSEAVEAIEDEKKRAVLLTEQAWVLRLLNRPEQARAACEQAHQLDPDAPEGLAGLIESLVDLRQFDEARSLLPEAGEDEPALLTIARGRLALASDRPDDAADEVARAAGGVGLGAVDLERLLRLNGELRELQGRYDEALQAFRRGAKLRRGEFDPGKHRAMVDELVAGWTMQGVSKVQRAGVDAGRAVFLLGLPGSGQDLAERIIACHPDAFGGGELMDLSRVARSGLAAERRSFRHVVPKPNLLKGRQLQAAGAVYLSRVSALSEHAERITDSNPLNIYLAGIIPLMYANAHIVFCRRDPAEAAWWWYTSIPGPTHPYAQEPDVLIEAMRDLDRLCAHWKALFEQMGVSFSEFDAQRFAESPQESAGELVESIGLAYDQRCAEPHLHARTRTAPRDTLRLPIDRWGSRFEHYRGRLKPDFATLSAGI